jgi:hypothetical protein
VIINTTFEDLLMHGFSEVSVESMSVEAGLQPLAQQLAPLAHLRTNS